MSMVMWQRDIVSPGKFEIKFIEGVGGGGLFVSERKLDNQNHRQLQKLTSGEKVCYWN